MLYVEKLFFFTNLTENDFDMLFPCQQQIWKLHFPTILNEVVQRNIKTRYEEKEWKNFLPGSFEIITHLGLILFVIFKLIISLFCFSFCRSAEEKVCLSISFSLEIKSNCQSHSQRKSSIKRHLSAKLTITGQTRWMNDKYSHSDAKDEEKKVWSCSNRSDESGSMQGAGCLKSFLKSVLYICEGN